ncbi:MAG: 3-oxoacyl-ACP synthase [Waddliaceae bacterium]|nr:3-oxoacyl-ACP synthase [Waddliaceae bacterium]
MTSGKRARIISLGSYAPERILSNADLEEIVDTSDEWIVSRTGIHERRIASDSEFPSDMGYEAATQALVRANLNPGDLDAVIVATMCGDYLSPSTAAIIAARLGATDIPAFDISAACTGFLYGVSIAKGYIESGMYRNVLVIAAEKLSSIVDYSDRNTCVLFGDAAAAAVISDEGEGLWVRSIRLGADGTQAEILRVPGGGCRHPASHETVDENAHCIQMSGREVFRHAVRRMEQAAHAALKQADLTEEELSWLVPHQANIRIIDALAKRFSVPSDRVYNNLDRFGNTSAAGMFVALDELMQKETIEEGAHILTVAFGAGLTYGSSVLTKIGGDDE